MAAVHLTKTYCLPILMYGCEIWTLTDAHHQRCMEQLFSAYFKCCWRESTKPLQFFCITMSIAHLIVQRKMIISKKLVNRKAVC